MDIKHVVKLVEGHAEPLAARCMERLHREAGAEGFLRLPQNDLLVRLTDVYREIGLFLDQPKNDIVRHYFFEAGRMRHRQGLPPEDMVRGIQLAREVVWDFVEEQGAFDSSMSLYQALNLYRQIVIFFDWAMVYAMDGYCEDE